MRRRRNVSSPSCSSASIEGGFGGANDAGQGRTQTPRPHGGKTRAWYRSLRSCPALGRCSAGKAAEGSGERRARSRSAWPASGAASVRERPFILVQASELNFHLRSGASPAPGGRTIALCLPCRRRLDRAGSAVSPHTGDDRWRKAPGSLVRDAALATRSGSSHMRLAVRAVCCTDPWSSASALGPAPSTP